MWYVKGTLAFSLFLSIFFSIWSFVITWMLCSLVFHYEYNRVQKENAVERRHEELCQTVAGADPTRPKTNIELNQAELRERTKQVKELFDEYKKNNIIGEA